MRNVTDPLSASDGRADFTFAFGSTRTDKPIVGKWNHGSVQDLPGVVRNGNRWFLGTDRNASGSLSSDGRATRSFVFGSPGDRAVVIRIGVDNGEPIGP